MLLTRLFCILALGGLLAIAQEDTNIVFHSDVALVRVDAQVLDHDNRAITGLPVFYARSCAFMRG